jgi:hypothetical protein
MANVDNAKRAINLGHQENESSGINLKSEAGADLRSQGGQGHLERRIGRRIS